jgi:hypothetical protein
MYCGALNVLPSAGISTETIVWSKLAMKSETLNLFVFKNKRKMKKRKENGSRV